MANLFSRNMPWGSKKQPENTQSSRGESLTTILETQEDRAELTLLLANASERMRATITDAFDPKKGGSKDAISQLRAEVESVKLNEADSSTTNEDEEEARRRLQQEEEQRVKELSTPDMLNLKVAALKHFDDWRDSVLLRVGAVINARDDAGEAKQTTSSSRENDTHDRSEPTLPDSEKQDPNVTAILRKLYPPTPTPLVNLPTDKKALILHSLLLLLLSLQHYSAHSRILLLHITTSLDLPIDLLAHDETTVSRALLTAAAATSDDTAMTADAETQEKAKANATSRKWEVGLASVAGAALIGITGGLAAPLLAAGIGTVMGGLGLGATAAAGYLGALAGSSVLVGGLFGAYGGRMTGKMMDRYAKEVQDFAFVPIRDALIAGASASAFESATPSSRRKKSVDAAAAEVVEGRRLRVSIGVSGWLTDKDEAARPWHVVSPLTVEPFALRWELEALLRLGNSLTTMVKSAAWGIAKTEIIKRTVFGALMAGLWPLALLKVSRVVDNPFSVAKARSEKAGEVLADALVNRAQGERPVTLIGYSLGARVIYSCLLALAERGAFGIVESVVLLGAPTPSDAVHWRKIRAVVAGRVVNAYSANDYILAFLYRTSSIQYGIAGLQPVSGVPGVENVDVSGIVSGHTVYRHLTGTILKKIGFEDVSAADVAEEEGELQAKEQRAEEEQGKDGRQQTGEVDDDDVEKMEKEVEEKNKKSMMGWASQKLSQGSDAVGRTWSGVTGGGTKKKNQDRSNSTPYEGT